MEFVSPRVRSRPQVRDRFDGLLLCYSGRYAGAPADAAGIADAALATATSRAAHWRHRLAADVGVRRGNRPSVGSTSNFAKLSAERRALRYARKKAP